MEVGAFFENFFTFLWLVSFVNLTNSKSVKAPNFSSITFSTFQPPSAEVWRTSNGAEADVALMMVVVGGGICSSCFFFLCVRFFHRLPSAWLVRLSMRLERLESSMDERLRALEECEGELGSCPGKKISATVVVSQRIHDPWEMTFCGTDGFVSL